jgi:hypothetical protein
VTTNFCAGRADYFGEMPNLAARVAGLAHPGQILVEGTSGFTTRTSSGNHAPSPGPGPAMGGVGDRSFNNARRNDAVTHALQSRRPVLAHDERGCCLLAGPLTPGG